MFGLVMGRKQKFERRFAEFWPTYLEAHTKKMCRFLHYVGTIMGMLGILLYFLTGEPWLIPAAILCGYGFQWTGHYVFEESPPLTLRHPLLSLCADFSMLRRALNGRLASDLKQTGSIPAG